MNCQLKLFEPEVQWSGELAVAILLYIVYNVSHDFDSQQSVSWPKSFKLKVA